MDWHPTELQAAITEAAAPILSGSAEPWSALAEADLLGLDSLLDVCTLLVEVGRAGARVPALETLVLGAPARATGRFPAHHVLTAAVSEPGIPDPRESTLRVEGDGLWGTRVAVPSLDLAVAVVVPARDGLWLVDPNQARIEPGRATNGDTAHTLHLEGTPATRIGGTPELEAWIAHAHVGIAALHLGLAQGALGLTATYVRERHQFGRPIGSFQAVSQRIADAWIDAAAIDVVVWQAAWRLSQGLPSEREALIARWQAAEGTHRVVAAAQHLHGGFGFDRDYPLHRYFLTAKRWENLLGGPQAVLARLGDLVATSA